MICAKTAKPIKVQYGMLSWVGPGNYVHVVGGMQIPMRAGAMLRAKGAVSGHARTCPAVDILKATQQGAAPVRRGCRLKCTTWGAHWRHLVNAIEPSLYGSDAALCQITLTSYAVGLLELNYYGI